MHSVTDRLTDRQTDGRTDNRLMPIADHTVQQYDRLKSASAIVFRGMHCWIFVQATFSTCHMPIHLRKHRKTSAEKRLSIFNHEFRRGFSAGRLFSAVAHYTASARRGSRRRI